MNLCSEIESLSDEIGKLDLQMRELINAYTDKMKELTRLMREETSDNIFDELCLKSESLKEKFGAEFAVMVDKLEARKCSITNLVAHVLSSLNIEEVTE